MILAVLLLYEWRDTVRARKESEASLLIAQSGAYLSNLNVGAAIERARRAFQSVPSAASRSALLQAVMELSPGLTTVVPLGADTTQALAWPSGDILDFATDSGRLRTFDLVNLLKLWAALICQSSNVRRMAILRSFAPSRRLAPRE